MQELGLLFDSLSSATESLEDLADISSRLHRNDTEFIFFIDPDEEGLIRVVEDSTALGPVAVQTASIKEPITLFEEEVVFDKLLLCSLIHSFKSIESASQVTGKIIASCHDMLHDLVALIIGDTGA